MHRQGPGAWFSDGREERELILKMGEPWAGRNVLEIGCGEGHLAAMIKRAGAAWVVGNDYAEAPYKKALKLYGEEVQFLMPAHYREIMANGEVIVMQGVLEHLDDPFGELAWMIDHFRPKSIITSSPCFINTRGVIWMTLHALGAVMSKTDLHHLHPWDFQIFCEEHGYRLKMQSCDWEWGNGEAMIEDFQKRIPLALRDGNLPPGNLEPFLDWLLQIPGECQNGATMVYRIDL